MVCKSHSDLFITARTLVFLPKVMVSWVRASSLQLLKKALKQYQFISFQASILAVSNAQTVRRLESGEMLWVLNKVIQNITWSSSTSKTSLSPVFSNSAFTYEFLSTQKKWYQNVTSCASCRFDLSFYFHEIYNLISDCCEFNLYSAIIM